MFVSPHLVPTTAFRRLAAGALAAALHCALPVAAQAPQLRVHHPASGLTHEAPSEHSMPVGHTLAYELEAPPGVVGLLAFGAPYAGPPILIGGTALQLDPASVLIGIPGKLVPASGFLGFNALMPPLPEGTSISAQGATLELLTLQATLSPALRGKATHKPFVHVAVGSKTGHPLGQMGPAQLVIQSQAQWLAFWAQHSPQPVPTIDFNTYGALVAFRGFAPSSGYGVRVDQTVLVGSALHVAALHLDPLGGCATFPSEQRPFHIVALPQSALAPVGSYSSVTVDSCN